MANNYTKRVVFQITFPHLFFIESKIGDIQLSIMDIFTKSSLVVQKQIKIALDGSNSSDEDEDSIKKVWKFETEDLSYNLEITTSSVVLYTDNYSAFDSDKGFKNTVAYVLERFFKDIKIERVDRMGLRYINKCPVDVMETESFKQLYNSILPVDRYNLSEVNGMQSVVTKRLDSYNLNYKEHIQKEKDETGVEAHKLTIDLDAYSNSVNVSDIDQHLIEFHSAIKEEFNTTVKNL